MKRVLFFRVKLGSSLGRAAHYFSMRKQIDELNVFTQNSASRQAIMAGSG